MATPRRFPLIGKALALGAVLIALVLALESVSGIVAERAGRLREAERSVVASLASAQTLVGPVLERDCSESWDTTQGAGKDRKTVTERRDFKLVATPATLDVTGDAAIERRYRGIFKVNGYVVKARFVAGWTDGAALVPKAQHAGSRLQCDAPALFVALGDSRGVRSAALQIDGVVVPVLAGTGHAAHPRGFHADVAESFAGARRPMRAEVGLELVGTGLTARWQLNALATTAPQATLAGAPACRLDDVAGDAPAPEDARRTSRLSACPSWIRSVRTC